MQYVRYLWQDQTFSSFCPPLSSVVPPENSQELAASMSLLALVLSGRLHILGTSFLQLD